MEWEAPTFVSIDMNAEIGGYQGDFDDENPDRLEPKTENVAVVSEETKEG